MSLEPQSSKPRVTPAAEKGRPSGQCLSKVTTETYMTATVSRRGLPDSSASVLLHTALLGEFETKSRRNCLIDDTS